MEGSKKIRMTIQAAKEIKGKDVVLVGVGLPNLAANFAKRLYSPGLILVYESGSIDCAPDRQPLSIGDSSLSENVSALFSVFETFSYLVMGGKIDVGYLGTGQIDPKGDLNTTVIGDYEEPIARLPGSGGACEILFHAKKSVVITELSESKFRSKVEFITSSQKAGSRHGLETDPQEEVIITDKCIIHVLWNGFSEVTSVYKDSNVEEIEKFVKRFGITFPEDVKVVDEPTPYEINLLLSMDPEGVYLK